MRSRGPGLHRGVPRRAERQARAVLRRRARRRGSAFTGAPPAGAFYAFLRINPAWQPPGRTLGTVPVMEHDGVLYLAGRIGCGPGSISAPSW